MQPVKVFISYARAERRTVEKIYNYCFSSRQFTTYGKTFLWEPWWDDHLKPAQLWDSVIRDKLIDADVVVCMLSKKFLSSEYIMEKEVPLALKRQQESGIAILGVMLEPCDYQKSGLGKIQLTPMNSGRPKAFRNWSPRKDAYKYIKNGLIAAALQSVDNIALPLKSVPHGLSDYDQRLYREQYLKRDAQKRQKSLKSLERLFNKPKRRKPFKVHISKSTRRFFIIMSILLMAFLLIGWYLLENFWL